MSFTGTGTTTLAAPAAALVINTERKPAEWLAKRFINIHNLVLASKTAIGAKPAMSQNQALALATFALLKLRTAELARTNANGTDWNAELTAAQALADQALAAVSGTQNGFFPTAQRIFTALSRFVTNTGLTYIPDPTALPTNWYEQAVGLHAPVAGALAYSVAYAAGIDVNLLSGVTEADLADTLAVTSINGYAAVDGQVYNIPNGTGGFVALTFHSATNHLSGAAQPGALVLPAFPVTVSNGAYLQNVDRNTGDNTGTYDTVALANTTTVTRNVTITLT